MKNALTKFLRTNARTFRIVFYYAVSAWIPTHLMCSVGHWLLSFHNIYIIPLSTRLGNRGSIPRNNNFSFNVVFFLCVGCCSIWKVLLLWHSLMCTQYGEYVKQTICVSRPQSNNGIGFRIIVPSAKWAKVWLFIMCISRLCFLYALNKVSRTTTFDGRNLSLSNL